CRLPSECIAAGPPADDTRLLAARPRALPGSARLRSALPPEVSGNPLQPLRGCAVHVSTPPSGRHAGGCGPSTRGNADPAAAWPPHTDSVGVVALCRSARAARGGWDRT